MRMFEYDRLNRGATVSSFSSPLRRSKQQQQQQQRSSTTIDPIDLKKTLVTVLSPLGIFVEEGVSLCDDVPEVWTFELHDAHFRQTEAQIREALETTKLAKFRLVWRELRTWGEFPRPRLCAENIPGTETTIERSLSHRLLRFFVTLIILLFLVFVARWFYLTFLY